MQTAGKVVWMSSSAALGTAAATGNPVVVIPTVIVAAPALTYGAAADMSGTITEIAGDLLQGKYKSASANTFAETSSNLVGVYLEKKNVPIYISEHLQNATSETINYVLAPKIKDEQAKNDKPVQTLTK